MARPFESLREYLLLITRFALRPSGCDFRRGDMEGDVVESESLLPATALMFSAFLAGDLARVLSGVKDGSTTRIIRACS